VAGEVVALRIRDNQDVKQDDLLVEIDPRDYEARLAAARAALDGAAAQHKVAQIDLEKSRSRLVSLEADAEQARAQAVAAEAQATRADADLKRARELLQTGAIAQQDFDFAQATARSANASLEAARRKTASNEALAAEERQQLALHEDSCSEQWAGDAEVGGKRRVRPSGPDPDGTGAARCLGHG
jgi:membrane fusion protein (multidrug efflux system)